MKKLLGTLAILALAMSGFMLMASAPALAASACQSQSTLTTSATTVAGGGTVTLTATFKDCNGVGVAGATVTFSQTAGPCAATVSPITAVTDANGVATTTVTFPKCPGQYTFAAGTLGVTVTATVVVSGGFPATGADAPKGALPIGTLALLATGLLLVLGGAGALTLRHRRS